MATSELERVLARHAAAVRYKDLPAPAVDAARRQILWALGTAVAGAGAPASDKVLAVVGELGRGCPGDATIAGYGKRAPALLAAFANSVYAKALEYEDKHWMNSVHAYAVGVSVVPAAFAVAEYLGNISGKDLLAAVAVATDVQVRMINGAPHAIETSFNSTGMFSHFGAAVAAGRLLGLTEGRMLNALGIAYTQAAGNYQALQEGSLAFRMQTGFGVRNGIFAAFLARADVDGPHEFLNGRHGLYPAFFKECDADAVLGRLGALFWGTRMGFKAYPCCGLMHQTIDAVFKVKKTWSFRPEDVRSVELQVSPTVSTTCAPIQDKRHPRTQMEQQFSLPWAIACVLTENRLSLANFMDEALHDSVKLALAQKISVSLDSPDGRTSVTVTLTDGRKLTSEHVGPPSGHPDNPLSLDDLVERYRDCVRYGPKALAPERTERAKDMLLRLEDVGDVTEVIRLLG
ncbi:MAG: MmgE/PrpD family protein [Chloroflexi bacterium]|nr:MmgE/PrpD family protein [Chloroflexota bacterium]